MLNCASKTFIVTFVNYSCCSGKVLKELTSNGLIISSEKKVYSLGIIDLNLIKLDINLGFT